MPPAPLQPESRPPAFVASCAFGAVGAVLLLIGLIMRSIPVLVLSGLGGTLSLVAALVWRSQLIAAWHEQQKHSA